ncbi:LIC13411 family adhesin [Leptospira wolffii]|uniref:LIC13411 family adhesin n=1 Tax=Leptospira wolffii TaxID=409998 RepID=UPI003CD0C479
MFIFNSFPSYKRMFRSILILSIHLLLLDCSTYWAHRRNDLSDVFTAGVESPGYGLGMRIGPLATGFVFQGGETAPGKRDLGTGYGLRGGSFGNYRSQQLIFGILGSEKYHALPNAEVKPQATGEKKPASTEANSSDFLFPDTGTEPESDASTPELSSERQNAKSYNIRYLRFYHNPVAERRKAKKEAFYRKFLEGLDPEKKNEEIQTFLSQNPKNKDDYPSAFLFEVEFYIAVRYGIRLGFNAGEFLDFLLGFVGLDILDDDIQ